MQERFLYKEYPRAQEKEVAPADAYVSLEFIKLNLYI